MRPVAIWMDQTFVWAPRHGWAEPWKVTGYLLAINSIRRTAGMIGCSRDIRLRVDCPSSAEGAGQVFWSVSQPQRNAIPYLPDVMHTGLEP